MGSEGPKSVTINVTGFKKFYGVNENPTEYIVSNLRNYVETRGLLPSNVTLGICKVLETAGDGAVSELYKVLDSGLSTNNNSRNENVVWLHLGVDGGSHRFAIERQAVNEASFCCPDELGWQPQKLPIILGDGGISQTRETCCSVEEIYGTLRTKEYDVAISNDAGRFVCNFVYYHSLFFAERRAHKSIFVDVPPFSRIDREAQMEFIAALVEAIATTTTAC